MRATWPGAKSGRKAMATGPLVVSRTSFCGSACAVMLRPCFLEVSAVDESHGHGAAGERIAERLGERERRAAGDRLRQREAIGVALGICCTRRLVGDAWLAVEVAGALEAQQHRDLHAGLGMIEVGRNPAGLERVEHVLNGVERREGSF